MEKDVKFLEKHNLMDYSILLAIEHNPEYIHSGMTSHARSIVSNFSPLKLIKNNSDSVLE
jgi:hypothetical protein